MKLSRLLRRRPLDDGPPLADDGSLVVVGSSFDPARSDAVVVGEMADSGVDLTRPLLLRHHLRLPDPLAVEEARRIVAQEGYQLVADEAAGSGSGNGDHPLVPVRISRPQQITGIAIAQERSRMVGLA